MLPPHTYPASTSPSRWLWLVLIALPFSTAVGQDANRFDRVVAPIFASQCLECHSGGAREGGLNLATREAALRGGDSGPSFVAGNLDASLLWERVDADEMPPKHPLSKEQKQVLRRWIKEGAQWGTSPIDRFAFTTESRAGRDWWSLQPIKQPEPPTFQTDRHAADANAKQAWDPNQWVQTDVDRFIARKLIESRLVPSQRASPRTLVRRLYLDLIGLPPAPEVIEKFAAAPTEANYQKLVDDLLASKHYGERWGRHWLDVVRFGESDGFERNFPRKNAWHYRDWVIDALNRDVPYDRFVRMQLIGDQLEGGLSGAAATGFWVAGVHNTVVGGSKRMKQLARQDEIEEVLGTVGQSFLGLTVNCARCHDHKYDPVTQKDFYELASAISGLGYGERQVSSEVDSTRIAAINQKLESAQKQLNQIESKAKKAILARREKGQSAPPVLPQATAHWDFDTSFDDSVLGLKGQAQGNARLEEGALVLDGNSHVVTESLKTDTREKTLEVLVQLETLDQGGGGVISIETRNGGTFDSIVFAERDERQWMAGSNGFARTDSFQGPQETNAANRPDHAGPVHFAIVYKSDGTIVGYRNGKPYGRSIRKSGLQEFKAGDTEFLFGLRHKPPGGNRFLNGKIYSASFYDRALTPDEVAATAGDPSRYVPESELTKWLSPKQNQTRDELKSKIRSWFSEVNALKAKANQKVYTLTPGGGARTHILKRGDPDNVGELVAPRGVDGLVAVSADFGLKPDAAEMARRKKLASWITAPANPLFPRVIVNRVWHYHFGQGIVDTPNDLGFNGGRPSHPELLDWLAAWFIREGQSLKKLHRLIVTSETYRQVGFADHRDSKQRAIESPATSESNEIQDPRDVDANNRLLWRMNPRRLEAESVRDSMLVVAGKLNAHMGGPSFEDVSIVNNNGTTYYSPKSTEGPAFWRRTVYRFSPRGGRSALLDTFDCPDSASTAPRRAVTTTPLQALSLLNNEFVLQMAGYFAERIQTEAGSDVENQVRLAWRLAFGRAPLDLESKAATELVRTHGLEALCRGLFNVNEFVVVE